MSAASFPSRAISSDLLGWFGLGVLEPPESIPLKLLGLDASPTTRDEVKAGFRARVMEAHPDLAAYTVPVIRYAAEALLARSPDVRELVWARDVLLAKIADTSETDDAVPRGEVVNRYACRGGCGKVIGLVRRGRWRGNCWGCARKAENERLRDLRLAARSDRACVWCGGRFTPARADGRYCSGACRQAAHRARRAVSR